jgi:hypothetical protein
MRRLAVAALAQATMIVALPVCAKDSLCEADETTIFSCPIGRKVVSACASPTLTPLVGYIQYRFGRKGAPEIVVPAVSVESRESIEGNTTRSVGGSGEDFLRFKAGAYSYVVYQFWVHPVNMRCDGPCNGSGIVVEREGAAVKNMKCTHRHHTEMTPIEAGIFERAGIPLSERFPEDRE